MCWAVILSGTCGWWRLQARRGDPGTGWTPGRQQNRGLFTWQVCLRYSAMPVPTKANSLTSEPNPTYLETIVTLDEQEARQIVLNHELSTATAREVGKILNAEVERIRSLDTDEQEPVAA